MIFLVAGKIRRKTIPTLRFPLFFLKSGSPLQSLYLYFISQGNIDNKGFAILMNIRYSYAICPRFPVALDGNGLGDELMPPVFHVHLTALGPRQQGGVLGVRMRPTNRRR